MLNINSPVVVNGQHHTVMSVRDITDLIRQNCGDDLASLVDDLLKDQTDISSIREKFNEVDSQLEDVMEAFNNLRNVLEGENA